MEYITIIEQQSGDEFTLYNADHGSILRAFEGFEYPTVRESIDDVAGAYGSVYVNSKFGRRRVSIEGDLVGSDVFTLRRRLLKALRQTGTIKLIKFETYDGLELQFEAEVVKLVNPYTHRVHTFLLELVAPDWRFYSQLLHTVNIGQSSIQGGVSIPATVPLPFSTPLQDDTAVTNVVTNSGSDVTDPVFTITGPGTGFTIGNITTGKEFVLSTALDEGDQVAVDIKNREVILNESTNIYSDITGDFWSLSPGDNEVRFFINAGISVVTNLSIAYRDAYIGV